MSNDYSNSNGLPFEPFFGDKQWMVRAPICASLVSLIDIVYHEPKASDVAKTFFSTLLISGFMSWVGEIFRVSENKDYPQYITPFFTTPFAGYWISRENNRVLSFISNSAGNRLTKTQAMSYVFVADMFASVFILDQLYLY